MLNLKFFLLFLQQLDRIFKLSFFIGHFDPQHAVLSTSSLVFLLKYLLSICQSFFGSPLFIPQSALIIRIVLNCLLSAFSKLVNLLILDLFSLEKRIFPLLELSFFFGQLDLLQLQLYGFHLLHLTFLAGNFDFSSLDLILSLTKVALDDLGNLGGLLLHLFNYPPELLLLVELILKVLGLFFHLFL